MNMKIEDGELTAGELVPKVLIKQEVNWPAEDTHALDLAHQEFAVEMEPLPFIKTEGDASCTDTGAYADQKFFLNHQPLTDGYEFTITELTSDQECLGQEITSESASFKQEHQKSTDEEHGIVIISDNQSDTNSNIDPKKSQTHYGTAYKCKFCPLSFKQKCNLKNHLSTHSTDRKREFSCHSCESAFYKKSDLVRHVRIHTGDTFNCRECGARFTRNASLKIHMRSQHSGEMSNFTLDPQSANDASGHTKTELISDEEFLDKDGASRTQGTQKSALQISDGKRQARCEEKFKLRFCNRKTHAKDRKREFACHLCKSTFYTKGTLLSHMRVHTGVTYKCEECEARFTHRYNLKAHVLREHFEETQQLTPNPPTTEEQYAPLKTEPMSDEEFLDEAPGSHEVQQSDQKFSDEHQTGVSLVGKESETCKICNNNYPKELIKTHISLTHCERKYKCGLCPLSFKKTGNLKRHMDTHAKDRKREFACHECENAYYTKAHLVSHMKIHSGGQQNTIHLADEQQEVTKSDMESPNICLENSQEHCEQRFKCELCLRSFKRKCDLNRHVNTHAIDRKREFGCDSCEGLFYTKSQLMQHMNLHNGERTYKCELCPRDFKVKSNLERHRKIHIDNRPRNHTCQQCEFKFSTKLDLKMHMSTHFKD